MKQDSVPRNRRTSAAGYRSLLTSEPPPAEPGAAGAPVRMLWARLRHHQLTVRAVAEKTGLSASMISRLEQGKADLTVPQAESLAKLYEVRPSWLAFGEGRPAVG
jgi:antitoxin component HigA of HigAB toxin-antitoxin module